MGKKIFTNKSYGAKLYKWSPEPYNANSKLVTNKQFYCTAKPNTQGQDWITTYSFDIIVIDGLQGHSAYVECDYVE